MEPVNMRELFQEAKSELQASGSTLDLSELLRSAQEQGIRTKSLEQIAAENIEVLSKIDISEEQFADYCEKLCDYEWVSHPDEFVLGKRIRWIRKPTATYDEQYKIPEPRLSASGKLQAVREKNGRQMVYVFAYGRIVCYYFDNFETFQQLTEDEQLILYSLKHT